MRAPSTTRPRRRMLGFWWLMAVSAGLLLIRGTSSALATLPGNQLNQKLPISAATPKYQGGAELCEGTAAGTSVWHFVLTRTTSSTATLEVTMDGATTQHPSDVKAGGTLHWFITTSRSATLTAASTNANGKRLNLSALCNGGPEEPPTAEPTGTFDLETGEPPTIDPSSTFDLETPFP